MNQLPPRSFRYQQNKDKEAWEWIQAFIIAVILALLIRFFVFSPFNVSGPSMSSTLHDGDLVIVNKLITRIKAPERGDIIVFHATEDKDYIKRVIALPGETVSAQNNQVRINGESLDEPYIDAGNRTDDFSPVRVPEGHVFVMGDNRRDSTDSRSSTLGPVPIDKIVGRADLVFWPLKDFRFLW